MPRPRYPRDLAKEGRPRVHAVKEISVHYEGRTEESPFALPM